jgi:hypothetical protein
MLIGVGRTDHIADVNLVFEDEIEKRPAPDASPEAYVRMGLASSPHTAIVFIFPLSDN